MQRLVDGWVTMPKWWKGFYITFMVTVVLFTAMTRDGQFALMVAFIWASMIAFALWSSEKLKERMRTNSTRPRDDESEREWRRRR
jgi:L-asparagine transporter-like permease